ncbi:HAD family hydrolase [uncultured Methanobrevibacter sp.]|uniref:HAD family hydrolase n=1 Tax=uncultured Methanobrevibacter sp. TaxID=253161 RepID=UPI0025D2B5EA|nr:HAD family hydrolase [uncultured Methanobrevibacter sp.]
MKRLAIFDFDGTLFDSVWDVEICFNRTLEIHGFPTLTHEEYLDRLGGNIDEIVSLILKDKSTAENIELVKDTYGKLYSSLPKDNTKPFAKTHEVLKALQDKGIYLAINSNRTTDSIMMYVDKFFKDIDFKAIEGHDPSYPSKPSPCGVEIIMGQLEVTKDETVYIGDSITDIRTSQNAEIDCILVGWGYGRKDAFESDYPIETVDDPYEILNYF